MLLREVGRLLDETSYIVGNIAATVFVSGTQAGTHIPAMRRRTLPMLWALLWTM